MGVVGCGLLPSERGVMGDGRVRLGRRRGLAKSPERMRSDGAIARACGAWVAEVGVERKERRKVDWALGVPTMRGISGSLCESYGIRIGE